MPSDRVANYFQIGSAKPNSNLTSAIFVWRILRASEYYVVRIGASIYILHRSIKDAVEALQWQWWWDGCIAEGQIVKQMDATWHSRARPNAFAENRLLDDGCCPTDLHWMGGSGQMLHFASELDWKLRKGFDHSECKYSYRAIDVDNSTYETKHVRDDCQCNFAATPPIEDAIWIIEQAGVPVVIMKMNDLGEIEALKFASAGPDTSQYVAFHTSQYVAFHTSGPWFGPVNWQHSSSVSVAEASSHGEWGAGSDLDGSRG